MFVEQIQDAGTADLQTHDDRTVWSTALFWGLLISAFVSFVAAFRRRHRTGGQPAPRPSPLSLLEDAPGSTGPGRLPSPALRSGEGPLGEVTATPPAATAAATGTALPQLSEAGRLSEPAAEARKLAPGYQAPVAPAQKPSLPHPAQPTRWREPTKYVVGVGLFLGILFIVYISRSVLPTIIVAALLALILHPVIRFFQKRLKLSKGLSIAIAYLLIIGLLVLIPLIVVPGIIYSLNSVLSTDFQGWSEDLAEALLNLSTQVESIPVLDWLLSPLLDSLAAAMQNLSAVQTPEPISYEAAMGAIVERLASALGAIVKLLGPVVSAVITLVFMLLVSFYLSLSGDRIVEGYPRLLPPTIQPEITGLLRRIEGVWVGFLRGQFTLMVFIGTVIFLGNAALGNPNALLLGIISGLLELIPNIGPALALIPGVGMALIFGSTHFAIPNLAFAVIVLIYYLLVQVFENQVVVPYLLGGAVELPPLVIILGVMVGGAVAGILGILLAAPIIATGRELFSYLYNKILEPPMAEGPPEKKPSLLDSMLDRVSHLRLPSRRRARQPSAPEGVKQ